MERCGDRGAEGRGEQVVRREGLMSNERLTRPQLILSLHLCFGVSPQHQGNNNTLIHYPFIPVIHRELLNNMLQICPPSYNSLCHLQYIMWKTRSPLFCRTAFEDYRGWHLRDAARIWSIIFFFPRRKVELAWLICHCQKHNMPFRAKAKVEQVLIGSLRTRALVNLC